MSTLQVHEIYLEGRAEKDLEQLPTKIFKRIITHIRALAETPRPAGCRKISGSINDWRIRIGDYRVIYEIKDKEKAIRIMRVRHRREVYR